MQKSLLYRRQIQRLERKLARCEATSRRYSWARLAIFLAGGLFTWATVVFFGSPAGWTVFSMAAIAFIWMVVIHRRIDSWRDNFRIWLELYRQKTARLELDWEKLPIPPNPDNRPASPLVVDLDLGGPRSLQHLLDTTISRQGSLRLAKWISCATPDPQIIAERQAVVRDLASLDSFRNRLALSFRRLSREPLDGEQFILWLQTQLPGSRLQRLLPWVSLLAMGNVVLFVLWAAGSLAPLWILTTLIYAGVYFASQGMLGQFLDALFRLDGELHKFRPLLHRLEVFPYGSREALKQQCQLFLGKNERPSERLRRLKTVTALAGLRMNPIMQLALNLLTPWDFWVAWLADHQRTRLAALLPAWLDAFHELEALIALGEFAALHPEYCYPKIVPLQADEQIPGKLPSRPVFEARTLGHPLLPPDRKVCNDLAIETLGSLLLITGSNMAGKSTFIRTVGINLCLAYAGGPVNAAVLKTIPFRLYTCIRVSDSLGDGFSYFYAEVKRLKGLLDSLKGTETGLPLLYLVDEIFRGTNNRERLIGSRAYVKAVIGAAGVGLIATHDLELATLVSLNPLARNVHFRDEVIGGKLSFDYRLRPGPSPTTNALKIMEIEGLPLES